MTLELVPWRGATVPVLHGNGNGVSRSFVGIDQYAAWLAQFGGNYLTPPPPTTLYGQRPAEPISYSFQGFVEGMLYADSPVAAVEAYRLRVFAQAPLLYQRIVDGRAGKFVDDERLDALRKPWPSGTLSDLMKRSLVYGDFAGNAFIIDVEDELVVVRPDWVQIVLEPREYRGGQIGWRQKGIIYYERGLNQGDGATFLPGEYAHFIPGLPDPLACFRGMSWLTPLVREVKADKSAGDHKVAWFENAASPNVAVSLPKEITPEQFKRFVDEMDAQHKGPYNSGKTLYTAGGADVTVIGANMQQADFSSVVGKGETRIANAGGVPPTLLSFSEGMQGSSLNAGNYVAAKRNFVDTTMRDLWANWCGSLAQMDRFAPGKRTLRLWYDGRDVPFLHEDAKDLADIQSVQATAINQHITAGFEPSSARDAVEKDDLALLKPTGLVSVQLAPPGDNSAPGSSPDGSAGGPVDDTSGDDGEGGGEAQRAFNARQLRGANGRWIDMGLARRIGDEVRKSIKGSRTTVDWRGVHVTAPIRGRDVTVNISHLDIASLALFAVPGPNIAAGSLQAARALRVVQYIRKALAGARVAEAVGQAVAAKRRRQSARLNAASAGRSAPVGENDATRGRPHPGQRYKHGWIPVGASVMEILTPDEAARDYGDELDRVGFDDGTGTAIVARSEGVLTIQIDDEHTTEVEILTAPTPADAHTWADYIDDGLDLHEGEITTQDGLTVIRTDFGLSLRWLEGDDVPDDIDAVPDDLDGVDLTDDEVPDFTQALRDMAYVTEDHQNVPEDEEEPEQEGSEDLDEEVGRAKAKSLHYAAGTVGGKGGQFKPLKDQLGQVLQQWLDGGEADPDPLGTAGFKQPQLKRAAEQLGLNPPKGMKIVPLKGLLMAHARRQHHGIEGHKPLGREIGGRVLLGEVKVSDSVPPKVTAPATDLKMVEVSERSRKVYDQLLGDGGGTVANKSMRQIVEQMEAHGWEAVGYDRRVDVATFEAPDGRMLGAQFIRGKKPRLFDNPGGRGDMTFKSALAHVVTPAFPEVGGPHVTGAAERVSPGLGERVTARLLHGQGDESLDPLVKATRALSGYGGTQRQDLGQVTAGLRAAAERNRKVADDRAEYNRKYLGTSDGEDSRTQLLRQRADEFEQVAAELGRMSQERTAYETERDRRAGLPLDIRPGRTVVPPSSAAPDVLAAASKAAKAATPSSPPAAAPGVAGKATKVRDADGKPGLMNVLPEGRRGASGDGRVLMPDGTPGPWGKYGASGAMYRHIGNDDVPRYLLVQQGPRTDNPGKWQLPGGARDEKENPYQAAARETVEELGAPEAQIAAGRVNGTYETSLPDVGWSYTNVAVTVPRQFTADLTGREKEISAARWMTADEIAQLDRDGELIPALSGGKLERNVVSLFPDVAESKRVAAVREKEVAERAAAARTFADNLYAAAVAAHRYEVEKRNDPQGLRRALNELVDEAGVTKKADIAAIRGTRDALGDLGQLDTPAKVTKQVNAALKARGITTHGQLGAFLRFDPNTMDTPSAVLAEGEQVLLHRPSFTYTDKAAKQTVLLAKAHVGPLPDTTNAKAKLDDHLFNLGRRKPADLTAYNAAAQRLTANHDPKDIAAAMRREAAADKNLSSEDRRTYELLAGAVAKVAKVPPYINKDGFVDLRVLATSASPALSLSELEDPILRDFYGQRTLTFDRDKTKPFSNKYEYTRRQLEQGQITRAKAVKELRLGADNAAAFTRQLQRKVDYWNNSHDRTTWAVQNFKPTARDLASLKAGPDAIQQYRALADALAKAKIPARPRAASAPPTELGDVLPIDEKRFRSVDFHNAVLSRGQPLDPNFKHEGAGPRGGVTFLFGSGFKRPKRAGLTDPENNALDLYTVGRIARDLNGSLRAGRNHHGDSLHPEIGIAKTDLDDLQADLDSAIENSELTSDAVLWRGVLLKKADQDRLVPGAVFSDHGFASTAAYERGADKVIQNWKAAGLYKGTSPAKFKILAAKGTHGAIGHAQAYEVLLPRDQKFRVIREDKDASGTPVFILEAVKPGSADYVRGRNLAGVFDYADLPKTGSWGSVDQKGVQKRIYESQGFDGKPQVVSKDELDQAIKRGGVEMFRGVKPAEKKSAEAILEEFRSGPFFYAGSGGRMYGEGIYAGPRSTAESFANTRALDPNNRGAVTRLALRRDARVISYDDVRKLHLKSMPRVARDIQIQMDAELAKVNPNDFKLIEDIRKKYFKLQAEKAARSTALQDLGNYAALLGYDAIIAKGAAGSTGPGRQAPSNSYYVVLNRTAILVQDTSEPSPKGTS